jgi:flagellar basal body rod protein FlgC
LADVNNMDLSTIALQGLAQAEVQLNAAASTLANAGAASPNGANLDVVSLSTEIVALNSAKTLFDVNLSTLKTADQILQSTINLLG